MNRIQFLLNADNQYSIQSPFLFELYSNVLSARLSRHVLSDLGISRRDRFAQLKFMLSDHYGCIPCASGASFPFADCTLMLPDSSLIAMLRRPHRDKKREETWYSLCFNPTVSLSVDLFDIGLLFTSPKLSRQHILFRVF